MTILRELTGGLVVSCQPVPGGPFDSVESVVAFARAAEGAGARGLRIQGAANVAAVVRACRIPVIGLIKRDFPDSPVRITALPEDVDALVAAGAPIVAVDATMRPRPAPVAELLARVREAGRIPMADCATFAEGKAAVAAGADCVASTMSGYTGGPVPAGPDLSLVRALCALDVPVLAEGRFNTPALAAEAIRAGAYAVVVGTALTRPETVITWFKHAVSAAAAPEPVLAFDIGGTKTLLALVRGGAVQERRVVPTARDVGTPGWVEQLAELARPWAGRYRRAAAAVTGMMAEGRWSSLNTAVLPIPPGFPLVDRLSAALGVPAAAWNDAKAAAWGEYRFGAGENRDMAFVTVSSGIGGGAVVNGRLLRGRGGMACSLGQAPVGGRRLEELASGFAVAAAARTAGHDLDARGVFAAASAGASWAEAIVADAASVLAVGLASLQVAIDPECVGVGGGVGLAPGFLERVRSALDARPPLLRPDLRPARLGADAGVVGAADLARAG